MDGTFSQVVFASYGNPSGNNGEYTQGWCHSTNSILKVSKEFFGKSTATIGASNGLFGDPCGGTYKRLYIVLKYTGGTPNVPTTTTTTTLPPPTCGPYENINVTGKLNGSVWGSGPYTDDSDMGVAAVHAGLVSVGETATLVPTNISYHLSYPGSTSNGITTTDWLSGWCGFDLTLFVTPTTTTSTIPETTTTTTEPEIIIPETTTTTTEPEAPSTTEVVTDPDPTPETTVLDTLPDETETPANQEPETQPNNNETVEITADNLAEVLSGEITSEEVGAVVDAITSGDVEITDEVADQLVDVLTSGEATEEQIVELVDALIEEEKIDPEVATELATSAEVLESITEEQATEIFAAIETSEITDEQKQDITEAVQNAPEEVKNAFEEEINIYADGFDDYVPVGSVIDVGTRRSLIAATTVLSTVAVAGASGGSSGGGGSSPSSRPSPSGGGSGGPDPNSAAKKEEEPEEDEEEEAAEIEGPEGDEEENSFTRNSIYKYQEGTMKRTFNPWGFIKKFAKETAALAFTISGTVIVFATLSGDTRKITLIATSCAFVVHYLNAMLKNDE